eukprot:SM000140S00600  [mRNA]  locus=s140:118145:120561:- [translate_table: standard]
MAKGGKSKAPASAGKAVSSGGGGEAEAAAADEGLRHELKGEVEEKVEKTGDEKGGQDIAATEAASVPAAAISTPLPPAPPPPLTVFWADAALRGFCRSAEKEDFGEGQDNGGGGEDGDEDDEEYEDEEEEEEGGEENGEDEDGHQDKKPRVTKEGVSVAEVAKAKDEAGGDKALPKDSKRREMLMQMATLDDLKKLAEEHGKPAKEFKVGDTIKVDDLMQSGYSYTLVAPMGKEFADNFEPKLSPAEMLAHGVFEGKMCNDGIFEYPKEWYMEAIEKGKLSPEGPNPSLNYFGIKSRLPRTEWIKKGWLPPCDPRGWFQWYCRYYLGRRDPDVDAHQISRWRQLKRHAGQIKANCKAGDLKCRPKQRQALLQWAHDAFI